MRWSIIEDKSFEDAVEKLGGYRAVDFALAPVVDALSRNPYGFRYFKNKFVSFRYAITKPIDCLPSLVVTFTIQEDGTVCLKHIEPVDSPYS